MSLLKLFSGRIEYKQNLRSNLSKLLVIPVGLLSVNLFALFYLYNYPIGVKGLTESETEEKDCDGRFIITSNPYRGLFNYLFVENDVFYTGKKYTVFSIFKTYLFLKNLGWGKMSKDEIDYYLSLRLVRKS